MSTRIKSTTAEVARKHFGTTLSKLRQFRGYESAYGFFHGVGGQEHFQFSYNHYLMIESGQRLPSVDALKKVLQALFGNNKKSLQPERRELCLAFLKAMGEGESIFDVVWDHTESPTSESAPQDEMLYDMAKRQVANVPRLAKEQAKVVFSNSLNFWCHQWLLQTGRSVTASELAKAVHRETADVEKGLAALLEASVIEKSRQKYRSKYWESDVFVPSPEFIEKQSPWLSKHIDILRKEHPSANNGGNHGYFFLTLESEKEFEKLAEHFRDTMRRAYLYRRKGPHKGKGVLCSAEWRFFRLFDVEKE